MSEDQAPAPVKRPRGRPRKSVVDREPMRETPNTPARALKMRAKPNWETMDVSSPDLPDRLHIPAHMIPDGMSAQWVTNSVYGQGTPRRRADFERRGWTPIHQDDFDGQFDGMFMPKGQAGEIEVDGLVLMMRPKAITDKAVQDSNLRARQAVVLKEQQLRGGDLAGVTLDAAHPSALKVNTVGKSLERIDVPKE